MLQVAATLSPPMKTLACLSLLAVAFVMGCASMSQEKPTITEAAARATALHAAPGTKVKSSELEREHGLLVYSYDLAKAGVSGITEVLVDAHSGKVVEMKHETAEEEAREAAEDARKH